MKKLTIMAAIAVVAASANAQSWAESGDAGDLPGTAQVTMGVGDLMQITGNHASGDADMFAIMVTDFALFRASTMGNGTTLDTQLFLFTSGGMGVTFNDDAVEGTTELQSTLTNQFLTSNGLYYLAISQWDRDPTAGGLEMWIDTPFRSERAPDGPGAGGVVDAWNGTGTAVLPYTIDLRGVTYATVPEPGTFVAIGLGLAGLVLARRRK